VKPPEAGAGDGSDAGPAQTDLFHAGPRIDLERPLRLLVCIGGGEESVATLDFAIRIVKALGGDLAVLYVSPPVPHSVRDEVRLSNEKLDGWETDLPGIAFLRYARDRLRDAGLLRLDAAGIPTVRHALKPNVGGAFELHLYGAYGENVRFRIREGQVAEEIRRETRANAYDLLIFGAGTNRRLQHQIAQFVEVSTLFVKNVKPGPYRFLICTGGEPAGSALAEFTARAARALGMSVTVLSVDDLRQTRREAERWVEQLAGMLAARGIDVRPLVRKGKLVKTIVETAGEDHVIVIGRSHEPELKKFFFGSRPIRVIQQARCPVLHVA
jgi:nucleotide-binding universal stress UspA family protein